MTTPRCRVAPASFPAKALLAARSHLRARRPARQQHAAPAARALHRHARLHGAEQLFGLCHLLGTSRTSNSTGSSGEAPTTPSMSCIAAPSTSRSSATSTTALVRIASSLRNRTAPAHVVFERLAASSDRPACPDDARPHRQDHLHPAVPAGRESLPTWAKTSSSASRQARLATERAQVYITILLPCSVTGHRVGSQN